MPKFVIMLLCLLSFALAVYTICVSVSQSAIEDKLDRKQWPYISDPAPINTTQTAVRWVLETTKQIFIMHEQHILAVY